MLRRDGVCEQRGRFERDDGRFDEPGEVFAACAGAALYRRGAVLDVGGFDERFFLYLEDVDLGLRLRLAGWRCRYEPVVARHAGRGVRAGAGRRPVDLGRAQHAAARGRRFPARWAPRAYRQAAGRGTRCGAAAARALRRAAAALPLLPAMLRARRRLRAVARLRVEDVVPDAPWRGPRAGGHPGNPR